MEQINDLMARRTALALAKIPERLRDRAKVDFPEDDQMPRVRLLDGPMLTGYSMQSDGGEGVEDYVAFVSYEPAEHVRVRVCYWRNTDVPFEMAMAHLEAIENGIERIENPSIRKRFEEDYQNDNWGPAKRFVHDTEDWLEKSDIQFYQSGPTSKIAVLEETKRIRQRIPALEAEKSTAEVAAFRVDRAFSKHEALNVIDLREFCKNHPEYYIEIENRETGIGFFGTKKGDAYRGPSEIALPIQNARELNKETWETMSKIVEKHNAAHDTDHATKVKNKTQTIEHGIKEESRSRER